MMKKLSDDFLYPYSLPQIAQLHTLAMEMSSWGLNADEVIEICRDRLEAERSHAAASPRFAPAQNDPHDHQCPECGARLTISPVNVSRCTAIGGPWKTSLMCSSKTCRHTELSEKSLAEWRSR